MNIEYKNKKLSLVGTGIKTLSHLTKEAEAHIKQADIVLSLVNEPVMMEWIEKYSKKNINLDKIYFNSKERKDSYSNITEFILKALNEYDFVCTVFYGHPTVFASPGVEAIKKADDLGVETFILPGISAEDCMFADLKINPGDCGCFSVEAMDLILYNRNFDKNSHLIIWQVAMIGNIGHSKGVNKEAVKILNEHLLDIYPKNHSVYLYEASIYPGMRCRTLKVELVNLSLQEFTTITSLYIPPLDKSLIQPEILKRIKDCSTN